MDGRPNRRNKAAFINSYVLMVPSLCEHCEAAYRFGTVLCSLSRS